jgi:flagellar hook assembly protein FlgD
MLGTKKASTRRAVVILRVALALVTTGATGLLVSAQSASAQGTPPQLISEDSADAYFFPFDSGFSNTTATDETYLTVPATVTATVTATGSDTVVKTLLDNASEGVGSFGSTWNGTDDQGDVVADGSYTIEIVATNSAGSASVSYQREVASGTPGQLTTPTAGATLSGTAGFVFTPDTSFTDTFPISQVSVSCLGTASGASGDGTWQASADTNDCGNGIQDLSTTVTVTDPDGNPQYWTGPTTSVTIANAPQLVSEDSADAYFFPSGDGFSDTTASAQTFLTVPATVTATVLDSSDTVVKTLLDHVSEGRGTFEATWDGTDDQGDVVADGSYTIEIVATNSAGSASVSYQREVASGTPGQLTTPTAGATLSGTAGFVFTPDTSFTDTFPISQVSVSCLGTASGASGDGTWQASADTNDCGNGIQDLSTTVTVTDPLGNPQYWTGPTTSVTIANAPQLVSEDSADAYFFPSGDGFSDTTASAQTFLTVPATVTATVLDSSDTVVKTLLDHVSEGRGTFEATWDGTDDQGDVVADGSYTIEIVATNSAGSASVSYQREVASGTPGQLTTPTAGATLSGTAGFVFTPDTSFTDTFPISQVSVSCLGTASGASGDGTWQASADTNDCGNGIQDLSTTVTVTDPLGNPQYWTGPTTSVTIANAPQLVSEDSADAYFFPSGDGFSDTTASAQTFLTVPATVTATVLDSSDTVVKTLLDHVSEGRGTFEATWDGTDDQGDVVADGSYTIEIVATNSAGSASVSYQREVASGTPGQLTTPTAGATLSGTAGFVFTPDTSFTDTFPISQVSVSCLGTASGASGDGTWQASADTNDCGNGIQDLSTTVTVTDPDGNPQYWYRPDHVGDHRQRPPARLRRLGRRLLLPLR